jgi:HK97 family phage prohead protease
MEKQFLKGLVDKESINEKDGTISVAVATDSSIDRDGDIIETAGIDTSNFERNPVLLYAHDYRSDPIGKVVSLVKETGRMLFQPQFAVNENPRAKMFFDLVKGGYLNAFSIGFIPKRWEDRKSADGSITRVFTESELLEISLVPVPANANALVLARGYAERAEGAEKEIAEAIVKEMEEALPDKTEPGEQPVPPESPAPGTDDRIENLENEVKWIKHELGEIAKGYTPATNGDGAVDVKVPTVKDILSHPDFRKGVLRTVGETVGRSLHNLNRQ